MSDITVNIVDEIVEVNVTDQIVEVNVNNAAGPQGPAGPAGQGVPVGGTTGQVLSKASATNYDTQWTTPLSSNIYNSDGTLTGTRTVNMSTYDLRFSRGITVDRSPSNFTGVYVGARGAAGDYNVALGEGALDGPDAGYGNTSIGWDTLRQINNANENTAVGNEALSSLTTGGYNTGVGSYILAGIQTGSYNIGLGYDAGGTLGFASNDTTSNSIFIGAQTKALDGGQTNQIVIGHQAVGLGSNTIVLGNASTSFGRWYGNLLLGTNANSGYLFDAAGTARITGNITASSLSGATTRMVVADSAGVLSTQTIPSLSSGGSSVNYYLNGSITASVAGYKQLSKTAVIGTGTNFTLSGNGLIAQFLTDAGDPNRVQIPSGAWNFELYFSSSSNGGSEGFYVELLKYDGSTFTSIASSSTNPESITGGTSTDLYLTSLAVPTTALLTTDRLAIRVYIVNNSGARTVTLKTEDNNLCEIITTFAGGVSSINSLTANTQYLATGTSGTDFNISSVTDTHTFNLPTASATNRGALSSADFTTFNNKVGGTGVSGQVAYWSGTGTQTGSNNLFWDAANARLGIGTNAPAYILDVNGTARVQSTLNVGLADANGATVINGSGLEIGEGRTGSGFALIDLKGDTTYSDYGLRILRGNGGANAISEIQHRGTGNFTIGTAEGARIIFSTASTEKMRLSIAGRLLIGTTTESTFLLDVNGTARVQGNAQFGTGFYWDNTNNRLGIGTSTPQNNLDIVRGTAGTMGRSTYETSSFSYNNDIKIGIYTSSGNAAHGASLIFGQTNLQASSRYPAFEMQYIYSSTVADNNWRLNYSGRDNTGVVITYAANLFNVYADGRVILNPVTSGITASAKLLIGTSTDSGFRLDVNGTARVQDNLTVSKNQNAITQIAITNTNNGTSARSLLNTESDGAAMSLGKVSSTWTPYKTISSGDGYIYNGTRGDISILNDFATGKIKLAAGGSTTVQMELLTTGQLKLNNYTATTSFTGTAAGYLAFDSSGNILSAAAPAGGNNIYTADGTLTAARTLTHGGFSLSLVGSSFTNRFTSAGRLLLGTTTEGTFLFDVNGGIALRGNDATTTYFTGTSPKTLIRIFRHNSTTQEAFTLSLVGDEPVFNTANADYIFQRSAVEKFRIATNIITALIPVQFKTAIPTGTNINYPVQILNNAGSERLRFGIDANEIAVIGLGNTDLRIRQTTTNFDFLNINFSTGNVVIEKNAAVLTTIPSAKLALNSTISGFLPPRMTTTQKNAIATPAAGLVVYDTDTNKLCCYNGTTWNDLF